MAVAAFFCYPSVTIGLGDEAMRQKTDFTWRSVAFGLALLGTTGVGCSSSDDTVASTTDVASSSDTATGSDTGVSTDTGSVTDTAQAGQDTTGGNVNTDIVTAAPDATEDTNVAVVPAASCREAVLCQAKCDLTDTACRDACALDASAEITTALGTLNTCRLANCADSSGEALWPCLTGELCWDALQGCFFDGKVGTTNCNDLSICYTSCKSDQYPLDDFDEKPENPTCEADCMQAGTKDAQLAFIKYAICVANFCNTSPNEQCQKSSHMTCGAQANQCLTPM